MKKRIPYVDCLAVLHQGKVRDTHRLPDHENLRLMVATDAVNTHNVVHDSMVPGKGYALTALSIFQLLNVLTEHGINTHIVAFGKKIYDYLPKDRSYPEDLHLRAIIIKVADVIPVEFIWRAYLAGSLEKSYFNDEPNPYGLSLPKGLKRMSPFPEPIFTPTDKSETDDPLNSLLITKEYPEAVALSLQGYEFGRKYALKHGVEIIDYKCEIGRDADGRLIFVDEFLNSDCCRMAESHLIKIGEMPPWMDKEIFRQEAEKIWAGGKKVPITFSDDVLKQGSEGYQKAFKLLTGSTVEQFQNNWLCD